MRAAECDLKRLNMGDQIAHAETTANGWPDGRILPVYSIEAGGSGRAYTIGDSVGRYSIGVNIGAGAELVHKAADSAE